MFIFNYNKFLNVIYIKYFYIIITFLFSVLIIRYFLLFAIPGVEQARLETNKLISVISKDRNREKNRGTVVR